MAPGDRGHDRGRPRPGAGRSSPQPGALCAGRFGGRGGTANPIGRGGLRGRERKCSRAGSGRGSVRLRAGLADRLGCRPSASSWRSRSAEIPALDLASVTTTSLIALKAYLEGEDHYRRSEFPRSERGLGAGRGSGHPVRVGLSRSGGLVCVGTATRARRGSGHLERARIWPIRLPNRERTLVQARWAGYTGDPEAVPTIREAIRKYPDAAEAWFALGEESISTRRWQWVARRKRRRPSGKRRSSSRRWLPTACISSNWRSSGSPIARISRASSRPMAGWPRKPRERKPAGSRSLWPLVRLAHAHKPGPSSPHWIPNQRSSSMMFLIPPRFADSGKAVFPALDPHLSESGRSGIHELSVQDPRADGRAGSRRVGNADRFIRTRAISGIAAPCTCRCGECPCPNDAAAKLAAARADQSLFSSRLAVICAAATAARLGDWREYRALLSRTRENVARKLAAGDSASAKYWDWAVHVTEAHGLWRRGRKAEALHAFEGTLPGDTGWLRSGTWASSRSSSAGWTEAERAFRALWRQDLTPAYLQLARILERTGTPGRGTRSLQVRRLRLAARRPRAATTGRGGAPRPRASPWRRSIPPARAPRRSSQKLPRRSRRLR